MLSVVRFCKKSAYKILVLATSTCYLKEHVPDWNGSTSKNERRPLLCKLMKSSERPRRIDIRGYKLILLL